MNAKPKPFDVISQATLRDSDLMRAMVAELEYYRPKKYAKLIKQVNDILLYFGDFGYIGYLTDDDYYNFSHFSDNPNENEQGQLSYSDFDDFESFELDMDILTWIVYEDLHNAMDDISPAGCSFGSHFGDGALFGFWPYEDSPLWR